MVPPLFCICMYLCFRLQGSVQASILFSGERGETHVGEPSKMLWYVFITNIQADCQWFFYCCTLAILVVIMLMIVVIMMLLPLSALAGVVCSLPILTKCGRVWEPRLISPCWSKLSNTKPFPT